MKLIKYTPDILAAFCFVLLVFVGACNTPKQQFTGSLKVYKTNGEVTRIEFDPPSNFIISNREDVDSVIAEMESLLVDLKYARDSMTVVEPVVEAQPPATHDGPRPKSEEVLP